MNHPPIVSPRLLGSWLYACTMLLGITACEGEPLDAETELRAGEIDLESLEPGQCLPLDEEISSVTTSEWTRWPGLPKGIIIDDHLLLTSVFEDNVMLRVDGPAVGEGDVLVVANATAIYDDPEIELDCGYCDGVCVDGMCIMDIPPFAITRDGICLD